MPRPLLLLLALLLPANLYAEETKQSPAVKRILDKAVAEVKKNHQEFDKANQTPLEEARTELEDLSTKLIKDGKTDEAAAMLAQIKTLDADVMQMANAPAPTVGGGGRVPPQKPLLKRLEGEWRAGAKTRLGKDGRAEQLASDGTTVTLRGRLKTVSPELAEITWENGWRHQLHMAGDDLVAVLHWSPDGVRREDGFVMQRIK